MTARQTVIMFPWPVSANERLTKSDVTGRFILKQGYRDWKRRVGYQVLAQATQKFDKKVRLKIKLEAFQPDKRRRDLDNIVKVVQDVLTDVRVYGDDCQIDDLRVVRAGVDRRGGYVVVTLTEILALGKCTG